MILECDIGNSSCKWRVRDAGCLSATIIMDHRELASEPLLPPQSITAIYASSVASESINQQYCQLFNRSYGLQPSWVKVVPVLAGVTCGYDVPDKLGVDRWLAIVAAWQYKKKPLLVVDSGSALTLDFVADGGRHLGGYIIPGERLMRSSLQVETGKVRFAEPDYSKITDVPGTDTAAAVHNGLYVAQLGTVAFAMQQAKTLCGPIELVLTGGGAKRLADGLGVRADIYPDLVLDGLQWIKKNSL